MGLVLKSDDSRAAPRICCVCKSFGRHDELSDQRLDGLLIGVLRNGIPDRSLRI